MGAGLIQAQEVLRVVGEIGIHLKDIVVSLFQGPAEAGEVGGAQSQFAAALYHVQRFGGRCLDLFHDGGGAIGGSVVNDQYVELARKGENSGNDVPDVLLLVVSGNDD